MTGETKTPRTWYIKQSLDITGEPEIALIAPDGTYVCSVACDSAEHQKIEELILITKEREALRKDAERYRFLRDSEWSVWETVYWKMAPENTAANLDIEIDKEILSLKTEDK